jgi:hypothetical protein
MGFGLPAADHAALYTYHLGHHSIVELTKAGWRVSARYAKLIFQSEHRV